MFAKDRASVAAFVSVKVQGKAGPLVAAVKSDVVNMRTFHMEHDSCSVSYYKIYDYFSYL